MVPKVSLLIAALAAVVLLFPSAVAQEESRVADTAVKLNTNPFLSVGNTLERGDQTFGFVEWEFCHGAGGFNPQDATFELTLEVTGAPEWLTVSVSGEPVMSFSPPVGPTVNQGEQCPADTKGSWELSAVASDRAPFGEKATITATVTVDESGTSHTYKVPEGSSVVMGIEIQSDPGDDIDAKLENATRDPGTTTTNNNGGGGGSEESPPAPVAALLIGVVLFVALARRR